MRRRSANALGGCSLWLGTRAYASRRLDTQHRARTVLVKDLGLDPVPELTALEQAILRQDPSLAVQAALPEPSADCPHPGLVAL
jgi:hypothetical protein